ncbi:hypothetical protein DL96DRAFT_1631518, partial [Flagelloscypha sp. PMI_526]
TCSRKCADEKLVQAVKTYLDYDQNIRSPDGTIAVYHSDSVHSQALQLPTDNVVAHTTNRDPESAQTPPLLPLGLTSVNGRMNSPPPFSFQVEVHVVPQMLSSSSNPSSIPHNPQFPSAGQDVLGTNTTDDDVPLIDLGSTRISEVVSHSEGDSS